MKNLREISGDELEGLFREATAEAVQEHLAAGRSVVGSEGGIIYRYHPDGTKENIGSVSALPPLR